MSSSRGRSSGTARSALLAVVAVALGTAGAMAFLYRVTGDDAPAAAPVPPAPPPAPEPQGADTPPEPPPIRRPVVNLGPPEAPPPPLIVSGERQRPREGTWDAVPAAARAASLGKVVGGALHRGLNQLGAPLAACVEADVARMDESNEQPTLVLNVETREGQVVIVDATPLAEGGATVELLACAINVVKGRSFPAPGAKAGERHRLIYPIRR